MDLDPRSDPLPLLPQELQVHRSWSPLDHPEWLLLEAEGQIQIRPNQFQVRVREGKAPRIKRMDGWGI